MIYPVVLINLFFVPVLPLYLSCKICRRPLTPSLELLFQYCVIVSLNHVTAHIISLLLFKLTGSGYSLDSARYTLIDILAAVLLFLAYAVVKCMRPELEISRIGKHKVEDQNEAQEP